MSSHLPNRWQEILRREAAENVGVVLASARDQAGPSRLPRWVIPTAVVLVGSSSVFGLLDANEAKPRSGVPFDRSTVISTRTAGLGANAEDLAPRPSTTPLPPPDLKKLDQPELPSASSEPKPPEPRRGPRRPQPPACRECELRKARMLAAERQVLAMPTAPVAPAPQPTPQPTPTPKPEPVVVNVGTRLAAALTDPVITGVALAPVTAMLTTDVVVGDRVVLPAGTTLVGEGFATQQGDRAQVVFTAVIKDGRTRPLDGWALQDGEMGLRGRVVRKGSNGKRGAAALLGAAATGLSYGLAGAVPGAEGAALATLGNTVAGDMDGIRRDWRRSDKVIRVEAGAPVTVYLRRDLKLE